jgi:hypothetical protein
MPKNETNIDLQCSLCPNNPKFSDVSHLLTHISSKGHLAKQFELQFRSKSEHEAKDKLDAFESWYHRSNLDTLLANRLAAKDQKKASKDNKDKKSRASSAGVSLLIRVSTVQHLLTSMAFQVKKEKAAPENTTDPLLTATPVFRAPVPPMHLWPTITATAFTAAGGSEWQSTPGYTSPYATPTSRREVPNFTGDQTAANLHVDPKYVSKLS